MSRTGNTLPDIRREHREATLGDGTPICWDCEFDWPCDTRIALDHLERTEAVIEAARLAVASAESYSTEDMFGVYPLGLFGHMGAVRAALAALDSAASDD